MKSKVQIIAVVSVTVLLAGCTGEETELEKAALTWEAQASAREKGLDWEDAVDAWEKAAEIWEEAGNEERARNAWMKAALNWEVIAITYESEGKWILAADAWEKAAEIWESCGHGEKTENARKKAAEARETGEVSNRCVVWKG